jgi:death on curing protein
MRRLRYIDLIDYLVIAEATLGIDATRLERIAQLHLADSALAAPAAEFDGIEFYPAFEMKAAVLCSRLIRNHPLPDGNKRVGFMCLIEFIERNGYLLRPPPGDDSGGDETVKIIEAVASGEFREAELADWLKGLLETADAD